MLINLRNALMAGKRLPYDAEVEYLQSSRTQWIDTGVAGQSGIDMDFGFSLTSIGSAQAIGGCWTDLQSLYVGIVRANGYFAYHYGNTDNAIVQIQRVATNTYYHVQAHLYNGEQYYILNGNKSAVGAIAGNFVSPLNIHLFRINASTPTYSNGVRIYALKIYVNGVLVRDYIPVRKGTVGYLYDRVSGKLFGNAGTGDFVVGPDKN